MFLFLLPLVLFCFVLILFCFSSVLQQRAIEHILAVFVWCYFGVTGKLSCIFILKGHIAHFSRLSCASVLVCPAKCVIAWIVLLRITRCVSWSMRFHGVIVSTLDSESSDSSSNLGGTCSFFSFAPCFILFCFASVLQERAIEYSCCLCLVLLWCYWLVNCHVSEV